MAAALTVSELEQARAMITSGDLAGFYKYMADQGYNYAILAGGLVTNSSFSGDAATNFLLDAAKQQGVNFTAADLPALETKMAGAWVDALEQAAGPSGTVDGDLSFKDTYDFHEKVFSEFQMTSAAWTLTGPADVLGFPAMEPIWSDMLNELGSNPTIGALQTEASLFGQMLSVTQTDPNAGIYTPQQILEAGYWVGENTANAPADAALYFKNITPANQVTTQTVDGITESTYTDGAGVGLTEYTFGNVTEDVWTLPVTLSGVTVETTANGVTISQSAGSNASISTQGTVSASNTNVTFTTDGSASAASPIVMTGNGDTVTDQSSVTATIVGTGNNVTESAGSSITFSSSGTNTIEDSATGESYTISNGDITANGNSRVISAGSSDTFSINGDGTLNVQVSNSSGVILDNDVFSSNGNLLQDQQYSDGKIADAINYSNTGVESSVDFYNQDGQRTADAMFNSTGQQTDYDIYDPTTGALTQDQQLQNGTVVDALNYSNGLETDEAFYNPQQQEIGDAVFNPSGTQTDYLIIDPSSGQVTQDQQISNGSIVDAINYNNGVKTDEAFFNSSQQETSDWIYNSAGQETQENIYTPGSSTPNTEIYFNTATGIESFQNNYDSNGVWTSQDNYNSSGELVSQEDVNAAGQVTEQINVVPGTTTTANIITFDPTTNQPTEQYFYDPSNAQLTAKDDFSNGQLVSQENYDGSGHETEQIIVEPGTTTPETDIIFDTSTGRESYQNNYSSGQLVSQQNYDSNGNLVSAEGFNADGQVTVQDIYTPGTTNIDTEKFFDPSTGAETYQNDFNGNEQNVSREWFASDGHETAAALFGGDGKVTEYATFLPDGNLSQDQQYNDGVLSDVINYSNGSPSNETFFDGQGNETQFNEYNGDQTVASLFQPGSDYSYQENTYVNGELSRVDTFNPNTGELQQTELFSGGNPYPYEVETADGGPYYSQIETVNPTNGQITGLTDYNSNTGAITGEEGQYAGGSDEGDDSSDDGSYWFDGGYDGGADDGGYFGGYGFAGDMKVVQTNVGSSIGSIAQTDLAHGDQTGAKTAETALQQTAASAAGTSASGSGASALEGAKWDGNVITWSMALPSGGASAASFDAEAEKAFATWAAASGLTFKEVTGPADIQIGFDALGTASTGVVGYTSGRAQDGQLLNAKIQLEDPNEDAIVTDANGQLIYSGTNASLEQVMLHEIGHALGLGESTDQNSIMYYDLTNANSTLDSTDLSAVHSLYGASSNAGAAAQVSQLMVQAMAAYSQAPAGVTDAVALSNAASEHLLAANAHH